MFVGSIFHALLLLLFTSSFPKLQLRKSPNVLQIEAMIKGQLLVFEVMSEEGKSKVDPSVNKELRKKTLEWAAVRAKYQLESGKTDKYICQLYEILAKGNTHHAVRDRPM